MTLRRPIERVSARSSTAPGSGTRRSCTGSAIARRTRATTSASVGRPWRVRQPVIRVTASVGMSTSVVTARASSPNRLRSMRSATSASTIAGGNVGSARATLSLRPSPSVALSGHEFGHSVPPTSTRAASRALFTRVLSSPQMLRWLTAGESHGPQLTVVIEGLPAGLEISEDDLRKDLARRQGGHGRGGRQQIETDFARIASGVRGGFTIGSPVTLVLENKDHANWTAEMTASTEGFAPKPVTRLRPGHADLAGALKYGHDDIRNVLERSSARETATRVAAGGVARKLLAHFGIEILSFTQSIGSVDIGYDGVDTDAVTAKEIEESPVRCPDPDASAQMVTEIDHVAELGDTIGGTFRVVARGVPPGLGSYV